MGSFSFRHRRSTRLRGYDYRREGAYFVTICTYQRLHLFGHIAGDTMHLNQCGQIVRDEWLRTESVRPNVALDAFVVMPNHLHGIIVILETLTGVGASRWDAQPDDDWLQAHSLGAIVGQFKAQVTKQIRRLPGAGDDYPVWQRNYHDHIIRNAPDLQRLRTYVATNPARWPSDSLNTG